MKKNRLFVLGLVTVFVALVSLTFVSSTWAKYTTTQSGQDGARVAYWGFTQPAVITIDLFDGTYTNVAANDTANVIAPGTTKTQTITFESNQSKNPEVAYKVDYVFNTDGSSTTALDLNQNFYWTLKIGSDEVQKYQTLALLKQAVEEMSEAQVNPGVGYSNTFVIGWEWLYSGPAGDATDTAMGNATTTENVNIVITMTAEQID